MICKKCGLDNAEGAKFCNACGTQLGGGEMPNQPEIPAAKDNGWTTPKKCILVAVAGIITFLLWSVFGESSTDDYIKKGDEYFAKSEYDKAIIQYSKAIKIDEKCKVAYLKRVQAYANKQEFDNAIADLNQAIALSPENEGGVYIVRGELYRLKGEDEKALDDYTYGLEF